MTAVTATTPQSALAQALVATADTDPTVMGLTGRATGNLVRAGDDAVNTPPIATYEPPTNLRPAGSAGKSYLADVTLAAIAADDQDADALLEAVFAAQTVAAFAAVGLDAAWYGGQERASGRIEIGPDFRGVETTLHGTIWFTLP